MAVKRLLGVAAAVVLAALLLLSNENGVSRSHVCFAGAAMENQLMDLAAFKRLEKMPTKIELIATIARLLNQVHSTSTL